MLQAPQNALPGRQVISTINQTLVSAVDPAFADPTKFLGQVYDQAEDQRPAAIGRLDQAPHILEGMAGTIVTWPLVSTLLRSGAPGGRSPAPADRERPYRKTARRQSATGRRIPSTGLRLLFGLTRSPAFSVRKALGTRRPDLRLCRMRFTGHSIITGCAILAKPLEV